MADYNKALFFIMWAQWDELLILTIRTKDDFLAKKISSFLHAYHYSEDEQNVFKCYGNLMQYIDHALDGCSLEEDFFYF